MKTAIKTLKIRCTEWTIFLRKYKSDFNLKREIKSDMY